MHFYPQIDGVAEHAFILDDVHGVVATNHLIISRFEQKRQFICVFGKIILLICTFAVIEQQRIVPVFLLIFLNVVNRI